MNKHAGWDLFLSLCEEAAAQKKLGMLLNFLLTPEEVEQMDKRVLLVQALLEDKQSQREISKNLSISISKITRGSNGLKTISPALKNFLTQQLTEGK